MATKKFKCKVCGYIHEGNTPPESCPTCKAASSEFEEIVESKAKFDTNSNAYTIIYASVVVVIVAFLLSFVSKALQGPSDANERIDKKKQILASLNIRDVENSQVEAKYKEVIVKDEIINSTAAVLKDGAKQDNDGFKVDKKEISATNLPLYICSINGQIKYVIPLVGKGLWGTIWGYIALNEDCKTVYGSYFSHESETAGLGARITETEWQNKFKNKVITKDNSPEIALTVTKSGKAQDQTCQVDGISGATLTSNGVNDMLKESLKKYQAFFAKNKK